MGAEVGEILTDDTAGGWLHEWDTCQRFGEASHVRLRFCRDIGSRHRIGMD